MRDKLEQLQTLFRTWRRGGAGKPLLEVQYHPGDIRKGVRYFFLTREHVAWALASVVAYLLFLVFAATVSPKVIADRVAAWRYHTLIPQRAPLGDRLGDQVARLAELERASAAARLEMAKIYLAYGFSPDESIGQGGYPFEPRPVPDSIFARDVRRGNQLEAQVREQLAVLDTFLTEVQAFESAYHDQVRTTPSMCPLRGGDFVLTSPFGTRRNPFTNAQDFHNGIDLAAVTGTPIYAPADGTVVFAGQVRKKVNIGWWRYGNLVAVNHGDRFVTLYAHCDEVKVKRGQKVRQGDLLATVGNTGWSTSDHLHYEVRRITEDGRDVPTDPRIYILDHRWGDEEQMLIRARPSPELHGYEPLPRVIRR